MKKHFTTGFVLGIMIVFLFGFTRDWDESTPTDSTVANQIDDYNRYLRVDVSDRVKSMLYGFTAGETEIGFKYMQIYEQASVSQPSAAYGRVYGKAVGGKCELHWQDEDGDEIPLTAGGNIGGAHIELLANMDLLGSSTSDITINTNKFTVAGATGNTVIAGTLTQQGVATLADTSALATSGAPAADAQIANKKYVDDQVATKVFGARATDDDDSNAMIKAHAYLANQDGFVNVAYTVAVGAGTAGTITLFIDDDTNPATGGAQVARYAGNAYHDTNTKGSLGSAPVASGDYFEVTASNITVVGIYWTSAHGTLVKCTDQD